MRGKLFFGGIVVQRRIILLWTLFLLLLLPAHPASAAEQKTPERPPVVLIGTPPVNVNMAGAGTLPKGVLYTALNASFADKRHTENGSNGPDIFSQAWLLKIRYGLTGNIELNTVGSYVNLARDPKPAGGSEHLEGFGDQSVGISYAPFNIHQGEPFALSFGAGVILPTAPQGKNHLPGNSAFGWRVNTAFGLFFTPNIKLDTEVVATGPFERGNRRVKRGDAYQWNTQVRYLFRYMDVALESSYVHADSADADIGGRTVNTRNGYDEWFVGPSMNFAPPFMADADVWAGLGVFFPIHQDFKGPNKSESARFEFKIGKLW